MLFVDGVEQHLAQLQLAVVIVLELEAEVRPSHWLVELESFNCPSLAIPVRLELADLYPIISLFDFNLDLVGVSVRAVIGRFESNTTKR